jgi:membrane fusion protein, multidrug efflux system
MGPILRNKVVRFGSVAAVCICTLLSLSNCKNKQEVAPHQPPVVSVVEVTQKDVPAIFEFVAQTQSSHLVNIQARVSGFLDKQVYTEGEVVKEGQVLFLMDAKPFQYQLDQAKAALSMCKVSLETARSNLARTKPLTEQNALSQNDLDNATGQFQSAAASVEQSRAQVETARLNLSYTTITSPITGITSAAQQSEGTYISTGNSLLTTVAVLSPMWVNFSISENEMQRFRSEIEKGLVQKPKDGSYIVEIILVDGAIYPYTGRITFAEPSYNSQTGTFMIRASVDNPQGALRPNQYVRVRLKGAIRPNAILVPQAAIQQGSKGHFVWVVDKNGRVDQRPVVVGDWHDNEWFIAEGLGVGEQVVVEGTLLLRPDMSVTVRPYKPESVSGGIKSQADSVKSEK